MNDMVTILYIEDDPGSQMLVQRALSFAGYRVIIASRGIEGLDLAIRDQPDLILMDINLPDLSGREVTTRLRSNERFRATPIVALTAQSQIGEREKALAAGLSGYLTKPVDVDKLPSQVERYLRGERDNAEPEALSRAQAAYNQELVGRLEAKIRELETINADLRRLDKIKDDFIQLTAHELRTPLTLVFGYSRLLQDSPVVKQLKDQSPEIQAFVNGLSESIERMSAVINEILTVSRIATGRIELSVGPLNLGDVVKTVVDSFSQASQQRNLLISFNSAQWPTLVQGDSDLLELALFNLIGNAIKYTPDGGVINLIARQGVNNVLITVQDTGIGINKEDQARIFERFYTAGDTQLHSTSKTAFRGGGLGLGLAISRGIVEAHGGRIWVESEGRDEEQLPGSTFYIDLPLQARTASPKRSVPA
ncbi:MAG TPA: hybrid sensor histidine kinase/response regulator [Aggregatilineales bacterium]|nr:hybrid sensor histidine kinase/response regulator [Aggregatilineales bacterium]